MEESQATVFYSWQSDSPASKNKNLIRRAITVACKLQIDEAIRIDEATQDVSGSPDIPDTILSKIRQSAVAVFDLTIVGESFNARSGADQRKRALPNPNVLVELGYAAAQIGWERIVAVFNTSGGHTPEELPFDLRHRRFPITYDSAQGTAKAENHLVGELTRALGLCLGAPHEQARVMRRGLDHDVLVVLDKVGLADCFHHSGDISIETIRRMLDLGMIWCDQAPKHKLYAYHFTYVGELLRAQRQTERC